MKHFTNSQSSTQLRNYCHFSVDRIDIAQNCKTLGAGKKIIGARAIASKSLPRKMSYKKRCTKQVGRWAGRAPGPHLPLQAARGGVCPYRGTCPGAPSLFALSHATWKTRRLASAVRFTCGRIFRSRWLGITSPVTGPRVLSGDRKREG